MSTQLWDVIVVGGGNAGFSAAIAAKQAGASRVLLIEKSEETTYPGGNSYFTAGMIYVTRVVQAV